MPDPVAAAIRRRRHPAQARREAELAHETDLRRAFFWAAFKVLRFNGIDGDYVEFGSDGAITFRLAFDRMRDLGPARHLWAFDSFAGLPESSDDRDRHPRWIARSMATDLATFHQICRGHGMPPDSYTAVAGFYDDTLRAMSPADPPTNIALAYIDCDMYSSTKAVLDFLAPRLKHGMILAFDDYFCWAADELSGERRAFLEAFGGAEGLNGRWNLVPYRDIGWVGASFMVERADLARPREESATRAG